MRARLPRGLTIEMGRGEPADSAADNNEIVALFDWHAVERKLFAVAQGMRDLERARMLAAQAAQRRRVARGLGRHLRCRSEPAGDGKADAVEEITP